MAFTNTSRRARNHRKRHVPVGPAGLWFQATSLQQSNNNCDDDQRDVRTPLHHDDEAPDFSFYYSPAWNAMQCTLDIMAPSIQPSVSLTPAARYRILRSHVPAKYTMIYEVVSAFKSRQQYWRIPEMMVLVHESTLNNADYSTAATPTERRSDSQTSSMIPVDTDSANHGSILLSMVLSDDTGSTITAWVQLSSQSSTQLPAFVRPGHAWLLKDVTMAVAAVDEGSSYMCDGRSENDNMLHHIDGDNEDEIEQDKATNEQRVEPFILVREQNIAQIWSPYNKTPTTDRSSRPSTSISNSSSRRRLDNTTRIDTAVENSRRNTEEPNDNNSAQYSAYTQRRSALSQIVMATLPENVQKDIQEQQEKDEKNGRKKSKHNGENTYDRSDVAIKPRQRTNASTKHRATTSYQKRPEDTFETVPNGQTLHDSSNGSWQTPMRADLISQTMRNNSNNLTENLYNESVLATGTQERSGSTRIDKIDQLNGYAKLGTNVEVIHDEYREHQESTQNKVLHSHERQTVAEAVQNRAELDEKVHQVSTNKVCRELVNGDTPHRDKVSSKSEGLPKIQKNGLDKPTALRKRSRSFWGEVALYIPESEFVDYESNNDVDPFSFLATKIEDERAKALPDTIDCSQMFASGTRTTPTETPFHIKSAKPKQSIYSAEALSTITDFDVFEKC